MPIVLESMPAVHGIGTVDIGLIEDLVALVRHQTFSRAADARHVTQPAFSRRIQMLERWVGVPLVRRLPRRAVLTPAGERFHAMVEAMPQALRLARSEALEAAGRAERALTIAATHALSFTFFPEWARSNIDAGRLGALSLLSDSMDACEQMMLSGEADFLLCHRHASDGGLLPATRFATRQVGSDVLAPFCAPDGSGRPRWSVAPASPGEPAPFLSYAPESGLGRILAADWRACSAAPRVTKVLEARLATALLRLAEDGRGIAWLPLSLVSDSLRGRRLVSASGDDRWTIPLQIVVRRPVGPLGAAAEALWRGISADPA